MPLPRLTLLSAVLLSGCATSPAANHTESTESKPTPTASAPAEPRTVREALAREITAQLPHKPVEAEGVLFRGKVLAAGTPELMKRPNGVTLLTLPIGTSEPVTCLFYTSAIDAGAAVRSLLESLLDDVTVERVRATDVKSFTGSPAMYLEGDYSRGAAPAVQVGRIKVMVHAAPVLPKTCFHNELGYTKTFLDVTESIATGLTSTAPEQPVAPYYSDVQVLRLGDVPLGFQYTALFGSKAGGSILEVSTTMVRPGAPVQLQFQDTNITEQADISGVLVAKSYSKRVNDTVAANVRLRREQNGSYGVSGQVAAKEVQAQFGGELIGEVGLAARLREGLLKGQGDALEALLWVPPADASAPTKLVIRPREEAGARAATMELGPMSVKVELDAHGFPQRTEIPSGSATVVQERLSQTGEP
ncbi:hypothetical protein [Myxococcus sp. NMCA1]|uniref:hypothetical protein n=1 Tax=Myxococcus sp. NMCA1 TaxID=2996785 RepID=UPI002285FDD7|nr:hypothetical protein [Myxococcus sp. NMCA1]WAM28566.1 hypothetical protein OZ403_10830 [Myxococcus sp. NMCA1]